MSLNFACSLMRPIDKEFLDVITEIATSRKIRLNMARVSTLIIANYFIGQGDAERAQVLPA